MKLSRFFVKNEAIRWNILFSHFFGAIIRYKALKQKNILGFIFVSASTVSYFLQTVRLCAAFLRLSSKNCSTSSFWLFNRRIRLFCFKISHEIVYIKVNFVKALLKSFSLRFFLLFWSRSKIKVGCSFSSKIASPRCGRHNPRVTLHWDFWLQN